MTAPDCKSGAVRLRRAKFLTYNFLAQYIGKGEVQKLITETQRKMEAAAKDLDFLEAARYRDELVRLKAEEVG